VTAAGLEAVLAVVNLKPVELTVEIVVRIIGAVVELMTVEADVGRLALTEPAAEAKLLLVEISKEKISEEDASAVAAVDVIVLKTTFELVKPIELLLGEL